MAFYEGSRVGVYNITLNTYKDLKKDKTYYEIMSNNNDLAIYRISNFLGEFNLFFSKKDLFDIKDISENRLYFSDGYYSNNKEFITYNYIPYTDPVGENIVEDFRKENYNINMIYSINENKHTIINDEEYYKYASFLLDDNVNIIFLQLNNRKDLVIKKFNIKNKNEEILMKINYNNKILECLNPKILNEKYYYFETIIVDDHSRKKMLYIVDIELKKISYTKEFDNYFTTIIELK